MGKDSYALVTGLFMSLLIFGIVVIVIWLGDVKHLTQTYVAATHESVTGLKVGSTVYYRGIAVGKVSAVRFDPDDPEVIIVPMEVDDDVRFTRGVYAMLELKGVTGLTQVALKDSGDNPEPLPKGDRPENRIPIKPSLIERLSVSGENTVKQTHELVLRLNHLMNETNIHHIEQILSNVESATVQLISLQEKAETVLAPVPALTRDARHTLAGVNDLTGELKLLSQQLRQDISALSKQSRGLMQTGTAVGRQLLQTTLPRANTLLLQMQTATRRFDRVAAMLETDPQALLLGPDPQPNAPGEPGFKAMP